MTTKLPPHDWHAPIIAAIVNAYGRSHGRKPEYVEIGVDRGHTAEYIFKHTSATVSAVDITLANLIVKHDHPDFQMYEMTSDEFFATGAATIPGKPDVIFTDGDHSAKQVWEDFLNALKIISDDGTIILHDSLPLRKEWIESNCGTVYRTVERLYGVPKTTAALGTPQMFQIWTLPLFPGLTLVSKEYKPLG